MERARRVGHALIQAVQGSGLDLEGRGFEQRGAWSNTHFIYLFIYLRAWRGWQREREK